MDDQITEITNSINAELKPRAAELRQSVEAYKEILRAKQEIYAINVMATELNTDVFEKENEEDGAVNCVFYVLVMYNENGLVGSS